MWACFTCGPGPHAVGEVDGARGCFFCFPLLGHHPHQDVHPNAAELLLARSA